MYSVARSPEEDFNTARPASAGVCAAARCLFCLKLSKQGQAGREMEAEGGGRGVAGGVPALCGPYTYTPKPRLDVPTSQVHGVRLPEEEATWRHDAEMRKYPIE